MTLPSANKAKVSADPPLPPMPASPQQHSARPSVASTGKPQRNSSNRLWMQGRQRRQFLEHLTQWSLEHDSSNHFHGKLSLLPQGSKSRENFELGKSVPCILSDSSFTDARQKIVIRLFPPNTDTRNHKENRNQLGRQDSMDPLYTKNTNPHIGASPAIYEHHHTPTVTANGKYNLVVRCGAGWISAREYLGKLYFAHLEARKNVRQGQSSLDESLVKRSQALGPLPLEKDSVIIRPIFRPFLNLPPEIRDLILSTAAGLSRSYDLCSDVYGIPKVMKTEIRAPISLATLFGISKTINQHLVPHVYHSTDFEFGLTGFTNFLWQLGPINRPEVRRLTFRFGRMALLHCIRWLAPDPVFSLFEPPVATNPRALQYFWRCQIQELSKELHLLSLTVDMTEIPSNDLPMVVAILRSAFGNVIRFRFVEEGPNGKIKALDLADQRLGFLVEEETSWRPMCRSYYETYRRYPYFFKFELMRAEVDDVETIMDVNKAFFDSPALC